MVRDLQGREACAGVIAWLSMTMVVAPMPAPALGGLLTALDGAWALFVTGAVTGLLVARATRIG